MKTFIANYKKSFFYLAFILLATLNYSCSSDDTITESNQYYIKYEVNSSTVYSGGQLTVKYKDENNEIRTMNIPSRNLWETNVGPVSSGFVASIEVDEFSNHHSNLSITASISLSINNEPFVLKEIETSQGHNKRVVINYTID